MIAYFKLTEKVCFSWGGIYQQHITQAILIYALFLMRYPKPFHLIKVVTLFLLMLSSALEDNVTSLSALYHKVLLCKTKQLRVIKRAEDVTFLHVCVLLV